MDHNRMDGQEMSVDLAVIGSGMAGMAAAIFAAARGLSVACLGKPSEISFSSGCLDLFSRMPADSTTPARSFDNPFKGIEALVEKQPNHPYARVSREDIIQGFEEFTAFMGRAGIQYHCTRDRNQQIITPAGTLKSTWCVPSAMIAGTRALKEKQKILIVDIQGLKGFGARQMAENLAQVHPAMGSVTIGFPGREESGDLMAERLTWDLETPKVLDRFIEAIRPHIKGYDAVGLPAILGIYRFEELHKKMSQGLGVSVFEIPTLAPSVTGMRTREAFIGGIGNTSIRHFATRAQDIGVAPEGFTFEAGQGLGTIKIQSRAMILATGRFLGQGLGKGDAGIKEMLFDLPVTQPAERSLWFSRDFFDPRGHGLNRAGIETDAVFRPLGKDGKVFHPGLFACGSILAHQDWKRERAGAGISIATAYRAVAAAAENLGQA